eukprot:scaffold240273_cov54-Prasinocladus_malaysianus.AAC.1
MRLTLLLGQCNQVQSQTRPLSNNDDNRVMQSLIVTHVFQKTDKQSGRQVCIRLGRKGPDRDCPERPKDADGADAAEVDVVGAHHALDDGRVAGQDHNDVQPVPR